MLKQKRLLLSIRPILGESLPEWRNRRGEPFKDTPTKVPPGKLLADLLKRQARRVMADVTNCQPDTIAAHIARLEDICDVIEHFTRHDFAETAESRLSGRQLAYPTTLADFVACMELTRKNHRCPEFVNPHEDFQKEIIQRLDLLAFELSKRNEVQS